MILTAFLDMPADETHLIQPCELISAISFPVLVS